MKKQLYLFLIFACLGITTEVFFTAFADLLFTDLPTSIKWKLQGHTYVWMVLIYGLAPFLFSFFYKHIAPLHLIIRLAIYCIGIFAIEYLAGFILDMATGQCPWEYTNKWAIHGYIRLDYTPFWIIFGFILERVYIEVNTLLTK